MEYQRLEIKDGDIIIRDAKISDLKGLVNVYPSSFKKHTIFQRTPKEILKYLKDSHRKNVKLGGGYIVAKLNNKVIGGILVRKKGEDKDRKHTLWIYNHIAVLTEHSRQRIGTALMNSAEQKIKILIKKGKIRSAKVEVGISENERDTLRFYKKFDFKIEGKLKSHFRLNELVYVMGKEIIE